MPPTSYILFNRVYKITTVNAEEIRLNENNEHKVFWKKWGPYLSERQWGAVREDYSKNGKAWDYFPHDHARSRIYRWGEDGLGGLSDIYQNLCFSLALWNSKDPILKERLFGLSNTEGNHGEDVKELYYYLDNTPTHSYMKFLYKYPQDEFPYSQLVEINRERSRNEPEYELMDTGIFKDNRYFDIFIEYGKADHEDILIRLNIFNRAKERAEIIVLPTLWFRNTWFYGKVNTRPGIKIIKRATGFDLLQATHERLGVYYLVSETADNILFTENETNAKRLFGYPNESPYVKDLFHKVIIKGNYDLLKDKVSGTKSAFLYRLEIPAEGSKTIRLRLTNKKFSENPFNKKYDDIFKQRIKETEEFYSKYLPGDTNNDIAAVQRQAFGGLLWSKQYYNYELETWLNGDKGQPAPPEERKHIRNFDWLHLFNRDIISMPDKWEYPWYAVWDVAFHCIPLALIDPHFAKKQLLLFLKEWYMHPNGQMPAYEWNFCEVNPPVHAFAALKVYNIEKDLTGKGDIDFLKRVFHKLILNFTWWVNRKDSEGNNIFMGGFLGLDNIGVFDRSKKLPSGGHIEQADGTSWMAMYSMNLMEMALEIARYDTTFEDVASKFFEHAVHIAESLNHFGNNNAGLWHEEDGFFYDILHFPDGNILPLRVRSLVGLTSLFAVSVIERDLFESLKGFKKRLLWFRNNRKNLNKFLAIEEYIEGKDILLSLTHKDRLLMILQKMLDKSEFLSQGGIRSISRYHKENPLVLNVGGYEYRVDYEPAESLTGLFGGNSNWRGPIWFPMNYLLIEALRKYYSYYKDTLKVEFPSESGNLVTLDKVANSLSKRLIRIFTKDKNGRRPVHGDEDRYKNDPYFKDLILFYEYFHGDTCKGLGASHQTGWTSLVANLIHDLYN